MLVQDVEGAAPGTAAASADPARLPLSLSLGFGVGTVGVSCLLNPITTFFPAMMATVLGLSPALAGVLIMGSKVYDIAADLVIGAASDRTRTRWGRRRPYMLAGAVIGSVAFAMIFNPWFSEGLGAVVFMGLMLAVYSTGYSLFNIPYLAMPAEMTESPRQRVSLISYRTFFLAVGQMISVPMAAAIVDRYGRGARGFSVMGIVLGVFILLTTLTTIFTTGKARRTERTEGGPKTSPLRHAKLVLENRPFILLMSAKLFLLAGLAATAGTQLLFFLNVLGGGYGGLVYLGVSLNIAMALSMPLWVRVIAAAGRRATYVGALIANAVLTLSWLLPGVGQDAATLCVRGALLGVLSAGIMLTGTAMLPDTMAYDLRRTGQRREGIFASVYAIVEKFAFATVPALIGLYISASGYLPTRHGQLVVQPPAAVTALTVAFVGIPTAAYLIAAVILCFYRLDENALAGAHPAVC